MKIYNKTSLPEKIDYNGKEYKCDMNLSADVTSIKSPKLTELKIKKVDFIVVTVLSARLRGKLDLWGQPYKPTTWVFTTNTK